MTAPLPAGLSVASQDGQMWIRHDGTVRSLPLNFGNDERFLPLVAEHLAGVDWTVNPDTLSRAERQSWLDAAMAATHAAREAVGAVRSAWWDAREAAAIDASIAAGLCLWCGHDDCSDPMGPDCSGPVDVEVLEGKLDVTPPPPPIPESAVTS